MLDEWATYITRKYGHKQLSSSTYLSEAEPFLERYAKRSPENQALIGAAGNLVSSENFLALIEGDKDEEGDLQRDQGTVPSSPKSPDSVTQDQGLIVFFPGIPGCAKSALCKEIINTPGGLSDNRPMHSLMGDLRKGRYWPLISDQLKKKPNTITLAEKNAPNEEVWRQIEGMTQRFRVTAVPVVPESEGTDTNPFSLDALAVFIYRVLQRANHPGNLDKSSKNPGYVLLMFYHLYDGKSRRNFDSELYERFGSLVKMPVLKPDRDPLPDAVKAILEEGINLFRLHQSKHGRSEPSKGTYAREWSQWESILRKIFTDNATPFRCHLNRQRFGNIIFAAVTLPPGKIVNLLKKLAEADPSAKNFLKDKELQNNLKKAHVTLAHKRSHGVAAVASYGIYLHQNVPLEFTALIFSDKAAALEARLGSVDCEKVNSKNEWPHATIWTAPNVPPKEANTLPELVSKGKATRLVIDPPIIIPGVLDFY
ncbi:RNA ligase isoform 3 [Rhynchospora pubera]|uniref:RNA ligase isoform 3 n=1 Tax=Rhynchospora pubera TaxID=906938 RepID=A0AAV8DI79_9POAL|nr:RNA ligase isoform 3 [Rhynchospora pubera]